MKQRNDTFYEKHVMVWPPEGQPGQRPFVVGHGEVIDHPTLIGGFTLVEDTEAEEPEVPQPKGKDAAVAAVKKEGEPQ